MASGTLSQNEIDQLLGGMNVIGAAGRDDGAQLYDFRRPHRVSKERLRTLEAMYERMVKSLEGWIIGRIRGQIELRLQSVEQFSFGEFTMSLSTPCASFLLDINDSGGQQAIVDIGQEFSLFLVDKLFGGGGNPLSENRPLTRVERMALRSVIDRTTTLLQEAWADHVAMSFSMSSFEAFPDILLQTANRDDPVLVANIQVTAGETNSLMLICLPFGVLDKFFTNTSKRRINTATGSEHERAASRLIAEQSLRATRVPVAARLPEFNMSMRDLASLTEGGIIATALPCNSPIRIRVGAQERFIGTAGRVGQQLAVQLHGPVADEGAAAPPDSAVSAAFSPSVVPDRALSF
jgi:flagellar motor switch protein FliM